MTEGGDADPSRCNYFLEGETEAPSGQWVMSRAHRDPAPDIPQFLCRILINTPCQIMCEGNDLGSLPRAETE